MREMMESGKGLVCHGHIDTPTRSNEAVWGPAPEQDESAKGSGSADGVHWKVRENLENLTSAKGKDCQGHIDTPTRSNEAVWGPKLDEDTCVHLLISKYCFDDN